jgi:hypothetical protein
VEIGEGAFQKPLGLGLGLQESFHAMTQFAIGPAAVG